MRRVLSLVLILSLLAAALCLPAAARSSDYIRRSDVKIAKSGTNSIAIKTTTGADSTMTSIGVTTIVIEQSANGTSWTPVRTYSSRYTAAMLGRGGPYPTVLPGTSAEAAVTARSQGLDPRLVPGRRIDYMFSYGWNYGRPGGWTGRVSVEDAGPSDHALLTAETLDRDA